MVSQASYESADEGIVPASEGWFVVNAKGARYDGLAAPIARRCW